MDLLWAFAKIVIAINTKERNCFFINNFFDITQKCRKDTSEDKDSAINRKNVLSPEENVCKKTELINIYFLRFICFEL